MACHRRRRRHPDEVDQPDAWFRDGDRERARERQYEDEEDDDMETEEEELSELSDVGSDDE